MNETILYIVKVGIILIDINMINYLYTIILLLNYNLNISLNFFSIFVISFIINFKVSDISCKLSLNNINCYLLLISNV